MRWHTVDYRKDETPTRGRLVNRGFWLWGLPRLMLLCRLFGHKPVVDGYGPERPGLDAARWVCCDRCGVRPDPQGRLDPALWALGQPYTGDLDGTLVDWKRLHGEELPAGAQRPTTASPGPWRGNPTGTIGGQVVIGKTFGLFGVEVKVGNAGSEQTLAAHLRIWPIGALYLHTERFGTWLQRRLIPTGYESRVISLAVEDWRIRWQLWAKRNESSRDDPWWMHGSINLDLVERVLGPKRYSYDDVGDPVPVTVRMPHGDDHDVVVQLQRQTYGRAKGRKTHGWMVDWNTAPGVGGIPTKPGGRGRIFGSAAPVDDQAAGQDHWPMAAAAAIAARLTADRARYGYTAAQDATV